MKRMGKLALACICFGQYRKKRCLAQKMLGHPTWLCAPPRVAQEPRGGDTPTSVFKLINSIHQQHLVSLGESHLVVRFGQAIWAETFWGPLQSRGKCLKSHLDPKGNVIKVTRPITLNLCAFHQSSRTKWTMGSRCNSVHPHVQFRVMWSTLDSFPLWLLQSHVTSELHERLGKCAHRLVYLSVTSDPIAMILSQPRIEPANGRWCSSNSNQHTVIIGDCFEFYPGKPGSQWGQNWIPHPEQA